MAATVSYYTDFTNAFNNTPIGGTPALGNNTNQFAAYNDTSTPNPNIPYLPVAFPPPGPGLVFDGWEVYSDSTVPLPVKYLPGDVVPVGDGTYYRLYPLWVSPPVICFREGSTILTSENDTDVYKPVETLRPGTLIKTSRDGYLPISVIGHSQIYNPGNTQRSKNRLYKLTPEKYPELTTDLYVTGCHSILVDALTPAQEEEIVEDSGRVFVTSKKYRLPAYLDDRAEPFAEEGNFTIWHFALEGEDERVNHGVYANGLLVESSFRKHVESRGGMTLVE